MGEIRVKRELTPVTKLLEVTVPAEARKAQPGEFVIVRVDEKGERIPPTIADFDRRRGTITLVVQEVGKTTMQVGSMRPGDRFITLTGPLGRPTELKAYGTVLCVGGGSGIAAIYPLARALKDAGNTVLAIIGARSSDLIFWDERIGRVSHELCVCTDDGSLGREGVVSVPLREMLEAGRPIDQVFAIGPAIMMKVCAQTTRPCGVPTTVSLNAIMLDGTGMCGGCRVEVDGPKFDGHRVNWDLLLSRQRMYLEQEAEALGRWERPSR